MPHMFRLVNLEQPVVGSHFPLLRLIHTHYNLFLLQQSSAITHFFQPLLQQSIESMVELEAGHVETESQVKLIWGNVMIDTLGGPLAGI